MTHSAQDEDVERDIAFALAKFPYQPPRSRDPDKRRHYLLAVARAVRAQLEFAWSLAKKPAQEVAQSTWKPPKSEG